MCERETGAGERRVCGVCVCDCWVSGKQFSVHVHHTEHQECVL